MTAAKTMEPEANVESEMDVTADRDEGDSEPKSPFLCEPAAYQSVLMMLTLVTVVAAVGGLLLGVVAMRCLRQRFPG